MFYSEPCKYSIRLIAKLKSLDTKNVLDFNLINKAIYYAKKYHGSQLRKSGEPFYSHPLVFLVPPSHILLLSFPCRWCV